MSLLMMNIIVLILEVLYYALFMKFSRKEERLYKYILAFILVTIVVVLLDGIKVIAYISFIFTVLLSLKHLMKIKVSLFDILIILIMLLYKLIIELMFTFILYMLLKNVYLGAIIVGIIKVLNLFFMKNNLNKFYNKMKVLWNNNNFYIRYITSIFLMLYTIASCVLLILKLI